MVSFTNLDLIVLNEVAVQFNHWTFACVKYIKRRFIELYKKKVNKLAKLFSIKQEFSEKIFSKKKLLV